MTTTVRDKLARDVLTEVGDNDRGRLVAITLKTVPDSVVYIDWMKVFVVLSHAGIVEEVGSF